MTTDADTGRYGVVHYHDAKGKWYAVIDKRDDARRNIVFTSRSRGAAHARKDELNRQAA